MVVGASPPMSGVTKRHPHQFFLAGAIREHRGQTLYNLNREYILDDQFSQSLVGSFLGCQLRISEFLALAEALVDARALGHASCTGLSRCSLNILFGGGYYPAAELSEIWSEVSA